MHEQTRSNITFEIGQIERLLDVYGNLLLRGRISQPNLVDMTALAAVLHAFYGGLENVFLIIAKSIDHDVPHGSQSHRELLAQMTQPTPQREAVISTALHSRLTDYLGFRHFVRHAYSFFLEWGKMETLVVDLHEVWSQTKSELLTFIDHLNRA